MVGARLRTLGSAFQVLCITHLPQIAAYADTHFLIEKRVDQGDADHGSPPSDEAGSTSKRLGRMLGGPP